MNCHSSLNHMMRFESINWANRMSRFSSLESGKNERDDHENRSRSSKFRRVFLHCCWNGSARSMKSRLMRIACTRQMSLEKQLDFKYFDKTNAKCSTNWCRGKWFKQKKKAFHAIYFSVREFFFFFVLFDRDGRVFSPFVSLDWMSIWWQSNITVNHSECGTIFFLFLSNRLTFCRNYMAIASNSTSTSFLLSAIWKY